MRIFYKAIIIMSLSIPDLFSVKGLVAVVTGGGTGIGLMIAKALEHNGGIVYIIGRREEVLQNACKQANVSYASKPFKRKFGKKKISDSKYSLAESVTSLPMLRIRHLFSTQ